MGKQDRRSFMKSIGTLALAGAVTGLRCGSSKQPNIIYINIDDLGWADLGFQGSTYYETPNVDRLASEGMVFTQAYAPAANCAPSRASCMTGQYTPRHHVYTVATSERGESKDRMLIPVKNTLHIRQNNLTIAQILKSNGYRTCAVGKWHISDDPLQNGFDINIAGGPWGSPGRRGYHSPYEYPNCVQEQEGEYLTDRLTKEAVGFIQDSKDAPFFLYLAYYTVHSPLQAKADYAAYFESKKGTEAQHHAVYASMIKSMDEGIGQVMKALKDEGLDKDTLVLFTSDNGGVWATSKQWPLRAGKGSYYEGGIREPLIIKWPEKIKPGTRCDEPVSGIDFMPTFLEAASVPVPGNKILDGVSLIPLLLGNGSVEKRPLFWHFPIYLQAYVKPGEPCETRDPKFRTRPGSVVRLGDWKLHEYFEDGGLELYNLKTDIGEKINLVNKNPDKVRELHQLLLNWRKEIKAPVPTELNPEYKP